MKFRREAIESNHTPDTFDEAIVVASPLTWLLIATLAFIVLVALTWSVSAAIETRVIGPAFIKYEDLRVKEVVARGSGTLTELPVGPGDTVSEGSALAYMTNPSLDNRIASTARGIEQLKEKLVAFEEARDDELRRLDEGLQAKEAALAKRVANGEELIAAYSARLESNERLLGQGISSVATVNQLRAQYFEALQDVDVAATEIAQLPLDRHMVKTSWTREILNVETQIVEAQSVLVELLLERDRTQTVTARHGGEVYSVVRAPGTYLSEGDTILTLAQPNTRLSVDAFLSSSDAKTVEPGMTVQISPSTIRKEEYGTIVGKVESVSKFPLSTDELMAQVQNRDLAQMFAAGGPPIRVRIRMNKDENWQPIWTSGRPPRTAVTAGTLASVSVVVNKQPPVTLALPTLRRWMGIQ